MKKWLLTAVGLAAATLSFAQQKLGLEQCITTALQNNLQMKQGQLQVQGNQNNLEQSKFSRYPSLNFNASQGIQFGRNINPFTNQFVEQSVNFSQFQFQAGATLFSGYQIQNGIKQNSLNLQASQKDLEANRNTLIVNVATAYLNALNGEEQLDNARRQAETTQLQLTRTEKLVKAGTLPEMNLYDIQAQLANDELAIVNAQNNVELAKLTLKQLMNLPANEQFDIERIQVPNPSTAPYDATIDQVFNAALKYLPDMEAAQLRIEAARTGVEIARGAKMPTLSVGGGFSSSFSSAAPKERFIGDGGENRIVDIPSQTKYVQYLGVQVPLIEKITIPSGEIRQFGYFDQLDFNRNSSLSLNLRMPIFNGYQVRYRIANAQIQQKNAELQSGIVRNSVRQNVEQAYYTMTNAAKRYQATSKQVESLELAFKAADSRFNAGAINSVDYNIAKTNLDRARINLIQAKYDYLFRTKILDFYQNKPLKLD
jgi:outer membrane protein